MKPTPYTLGDSEQDQLRELITEAIDWAAHDNAKNEHVPQFVQARRIYIHPETREFGHWDGNRGHSGSTGFEEKGYTYLCQVDQFDVDPLDDGTSALDAEGVGADPADTLFEDLLEKAARNLMESEHDGN